MTMRGAGDAEGMEQGRASRPSWIEIDAGGEPDRSELALAKSGARLNRAIDECLGLVDERLGLHPPPLR